MSANSSSIVTFEFETSRGMSNDESLDNHALRPRRLRASRSAIDESVSSDDGWTEHSRMSTESDRTLTRHSLTTTRRNSMSPEAEREDEPYHLRLHNFVHWANDLFSALNELRADIRMPPIQRRYELSTTALHQARTLYYSLHRHTTSGNDLFSFRQLRHTIQRHSNGPYAQMGTTDMYETNDVAMDIDEELPMDDVGDGNMIAMRWDISYFHPYTAFYLWTRMSPIFLSFVTAGLAAYGGVAAYGKQDDVIVVFNVSEFRYNEHRRRELSRSYDDVAHWFSYQQMQRDSFRPPDLVHEMEIAHSDFEDSTDIDSLDSFDLDSCADDDDDDEEEEGFAHDGDEGTQDGNHSGI